VLPPLIAIEVASIEANVCVGGEAQRDTGFTPGRAKRGRWCPGDWQIARASSEESGKRWRDSRNTGSARAYAFFYLPCDSTDETYRQGREVRRELAAEACVRDVIDGCDPRCERGERRFDVMGDDDCGLETSR